MIHSVLAKFTVEEVANQVGCQRIKASAVMGGEGDNKDFTDATPYGEATIYAGKGSRAEGFFSPGEEFYMLFTTEKPQDRPDFFVAQFTVGKTVDFGSGQEVHFAAHYKEDVNPDIVGEPCTGLTSTIMMGIWSEDGDNPVRAADFFYAQQKLYVQFQKDDGSPL